MDQRLDRPMRWLACVVMALGLVLGGFDGLVAQAGGRVHGTIVERGTSRPLPGATVRLEPVPGGLMRRNAPGAEPVQALTVVTAGDGAYRFEDLPPGHYGLTVERLGYARARATVALRAPVGPRLDVALEVQPIALEPLSVVTAAASLAATDLGIARPPRTALRVEELRRSLFVEQDSWLLGYREVVAAATPGEPDLLRALQRLPGVSTRDDYSAELWVRGSPWAGTRVLLDDMPLFAPFLVGSAMTALPPSAIASVALRTGARPASAPGGYAGTVELRTRAASGGPGGNVQAEVGVLTAQASAEERVLGGRVGVLVAGRRSWFDQVWNAFVDDGFDPDGPFDYVVDSRLWRVDVAATDAVSIDAGSYRAADAIGGNVAGVVTGSRGRWGSAVDQVGAAWHLGAHRLHVAAGRSRTFGSVSSDPGSVYLEAEPSRRVLPVGSFEVRADVARVSLGPSAVAEGGLGAGVDATRLSARGAGAAGAARDPDGGGTPADASRLIVEAWTEYRGAWRAKVEYQLGARAPVVGRPVGGGLGLQPHVALRVRVSAATDVTGAWRRGHESLQQVSAAGARFFGGQTFGHVWLVAGDGVPTAETDVVTLGADRALRPGLHVGASAWHRRSDGLALPDPTVGTFAQAPVRWMPGSERAHGAEVQLRRTTGRVTGHATYAWADGTLRTALHAWPSPAARTHGLDILASVRARRGLDVGASLRARSGTRETPTVREACAAAGDAPCLPGSISEAVGSAGSLRGPAYAAVDLSLRWSRERETWGMALSLQVTDVLGTGDRGGYLGRSCPPPTGLAACLASPGAVDRFQARPGPLPTASLRLWF